MNWFIPKSKQAQFHNGRRSNGLAEEFDVTNDVIKITITTNQKCRFPATIVKKTPKITWDLRHLAERSPYSNKVPKKYVVWDIVLLEIASVLKF